MSNIVHCSQKDGYSNIKVLKYSVNEGLTICIVSWREGDKWSFIYGKLSGDANSSDRGIDRYINMWLFEQMIG